MRERREIKKEEEDEKERGQGIHKGEKDRKEKVGKGRIKEVTERGEGI